MCSLADEHIGCFQFGAMINKAAKKIHVKILEETYVFISLESKSGGGKGWGHMKDVFLTF